jgi:acyl-CoA thioesterase-1
MYRFFSFSFGCKFLVALAVLTGAARLQAGTSPGKPLVVLLGDSIRMGYEATVIADLADVADVWAPADNCQHTAYGLAHLQKWLEGRDPVLIHVNFGLHDFYLPDSKTPRHTIAQYQANLDAIFEWLTTHTRAKVIFANTTPVDEERQITSDVYHRLVRREADVDRYNAAAMDVVRRRGISVDDLHQVVIDGGGVKSLGKYDGVHFTPEGFQVLGHAVAQNIRQALTRK